ncbi:hypothetical protein R8Z50_22235 [Longispora sp. K20-0274]|uniref:hypothetical protein n=1 Tax=Longispora sp. K20-0274 TaxID=3088255 RepID=UPI00399A85E1
MIYPVIETLWAEGRPVVGEMYLVIDRLATFGRMPRAMDELVLGYMPRDLGDD